MLRSSYHQDQRKLFEHTYKIVQILVQFFNIIFHVLELPAILPILCKLLSFSLC